MTSMSGCIMVLVSLSQIVPTKYPLPIHAYNKNHQLWVNLRLLESKTALKYLKLIDKYESKYLIAKTS
jgi:hypothetical protein